MDCLYALQRLGYEFELKGGTSLFKGVQVHPCATKVGTTASPLRYDAAARDASQSAMLRHLKDLALRFAGAAFDFAGWSGDLSIAALSVNPRIDAMCQERTCTGAG